MVYLADDSFLVRKHERGAMDFGALGLQDGEDDRKSAAPAGRSAARAGRTGAAILEKAPMWLSLVGFAVWYWVYARHSVDGMRWAVSKLLA